MLNVVRQYVCTTERSTGIERSTGMERSTGIERSTGMERSISKCVQQSLVRFTFIVHTYTVLVNIVNILPEHMFT